MKQIPHFLISFQFLFLKGDPKNLLNAPHKVVLSESTAKKIFGNENPIDKPIKIGTDYNKIYCFRSDG